NLRKRLNRTVATSAMPMGMPGWPELACCTASMASARMALAMSLWPTAAVWRGMAVEGTACSIWKPAIIRRKRADHAGQCRPRQLLLRLHQKLLKLRRFSGPAGSRHCAAAAGFRWMFRSRAEASFQGSGWLVLPGDDLRHLGRGSVADQTVEIENRDHPFIARHQGAEEPGIGFHAGLRHGLQFALFDRKDVGDRIDQ